MLIDKRKGDKMSYKFKIVRGNAILNFSEEYCQSRCQLIESESFARVLRGFVNEGKRKENTTYTYLREVKSESIDIVNDLLAQNGVNLRGAVTPTTISQIDPTVTTGISRDQAMSNIRKYFNDNRDMFKEMGLTDTATDDEILSTLVARNSFFNSEDNVSVMKKYTDNNVLFRGQKFSTSDETSAYANMSPKPGTTGNVLATPDAVFASTYAGTGVLANGGAGVSAQHVGNITVGNNRIGFLNVYSGSPNDVYYGNVGIEQLDDINPYVPLSNHNNNIPETLITPTDNPVIDRYMVVNDRGRGGQTLDFMVA